MRKRFIAGAACPSCGLVDKIYLIGEGLEAKRCCNSCDFVERLGDVPESPDVAVVNIVPGVPSQAQKDSGGE